MLMFGTNCKEPGHQLRSIRMDELFEFIKESPRGLVKQTQTLRTIRRYSPDRYRTMKTSLPFFGCSSFSPPMRKKEHFTHAVGCIMDIDWKTTPDMDAYQLIRHDPRVVLSYISPSKAGAKLVFLFDEAICDALQYSSVYKRFIHRFAHNYHIADVVDFRNSDVSRISFICHDPEAHYNPHALRIYTDEYLSEISLVPSEEETKPKEKKDIPPDVYKGILEKLGTRPVRPKNTPPVRDIFRQILPLLKERLNEYNIHVENVEGIQYGIKLHLKLGADKGEVNIYHGHKGFSVISSPKKGTKYELNEVARHIIHSALPII